MLGKDFEKSMFSLFEPSTKKFIIVVTLLEKISRNAKCSITTDDQYIAGCIHGSKWMAVRNILLKESIKRVKILACPHLKKLP